MKHLTAMLRHRLDGIRRHRRKRTLIIVAAGSAIGITLLISLTASRLAGSSGGSNANARRTEVTALGWLEPKTELINVSGPTGTRVISLAVREGDRVKAGEDIAHLDGYVQALAQVQRAKVLLKEGRELYDADTRSGEAAVELAKLDLRQTDSIMPLEIKAQEAQVNRYRSDLDNARHNLQRLKSLYQHKRVTEQQVDDQSTTVQELEQQLAEAGFTLQRLKQSQAIEHAQDQQKLQSADAALKRSQIGDRVQSLAADLAVAKANLEQLTIRAPFSGRILKVLTWPGEQIGSNPIVKMGNTDSMYAVAEVYETDIRFVHLGMHATITSPALAGPIRGTVTRVGKLIFKNQVIDVDPAARVDARIVQVRIRLDQSKPVAGLSNMEVHVRIDLSSHPNPARDKTG